MIEYFFMSILLGGNFNVVRKIDEVQNYIEDCEVCCQPIQIEYLFQKELERFNVIS